MERTNNGARTASNDPRTPPKPGVVGTPMMTPENQLTGARFTLNQSAFRFSNLSGGIAPQVEISTVLKDLKDNYEQFETTIVENTKRQR